MSDAVLSDWRVDPVSAPYSVDSFVTLIAARRTGSADNLATALIHA
ncbi:hypothetical protein [Actinoplanes couchii]|nr:hypothetical protein [Actinoplanes couchii]MDR6324118.1 hypothetical protein [Actinoplanes couchii]